MNSIITNEEVFQQLECHSSYVSVVELAMILKANTSEVRQKLKKIGDRVTQNGHNEY